MLIDLYHPSPTLALEGLAMLEDELPAEISFQVPEVFHKRIIGVGGKNIQRIMKKYGVYVKFSNAQEFATLGGYYEPEDNVIARTPAKNADGLYSLKQSIMEILEEENPEEPKIIDWFAIPRQYHTRVIGFQGSKLKEIQQITDTVISFPDIQDGHDGVKITGSEANVQRAKSTLESLVPLKIEFMHRATQGIRSYLQSPQFAELSAQIYDDVGIDVFVRVIPDAEYVVFIFYYAQGNNRVQEALNLLNEHLKKNDASGTQSKSKNPNQLQSQGSIDSFMHFNSKLFAPLGGEVEKKSFDLLQDPYPLGNLRQVSSGKSNHSVPDLRAVFDDAVQGYDAFQNRAAKHLQPDLFEESPSKDTLGLLSATLAATNLDESPGYNMDTMAYVCLIHLPVNRANISQQGDKNQVYHHAPFATVQPSYPPNALWPTTYPGFNSPPNPTASSSQSDVQLKMPSNKYCGLSLSQSVPSGLNEQGENEQVCQINTRFLNLMNQAQQQQQAKGPWRPVEKGNPWAPSNETWANHVSKPLYGFAASPSSTTTSSPQQKPHSSKPAYYNQRKQ